MDYETFGEHQWESTGIFQFMEALPDVLLSRPGFTFALLQPGSGQPHWKPGAASP